MAFKAKDGALRRLNGMDRRFRGSLGEAQHAAGQLLVRTSQSGQSSGPKTGRMYGSHQASSPGEYSAPRTWSLHNSTAYEVTGNTIHFGVGVEHGLYQELGTRKMGARQNLGNAVDATQDELLNVFGAQLLRRVVGGGR